MTPLRAFAAATSPHPRGQVPPADSPRRHIRIAPAKHLRVDLAELWAYRGLFLFLVWRDIKVRYAQTVLGALWAILQPVFTMVIFTVIFGRFVRVSSDGVPYPVFALAALVPWSYFATALNGASTSLTYSTHLVTRVYFPRLVIPSAPVLAGVVDFSAAFLALLAFMLAYGITPTAGILAVPLLLGLLAMTALGVGCWLAALNIQYRDIRHVTTFLVQVWMYASPIVYPLSVVPPEYRTIYALNPVVGAVAGFRAVLLGTPGPSALELAVSTGAAAVLLLSGLLYFARTERFFADVA